MSAFLSHTVTKRFHLKLRRRARPAAISTNRVNEYLVNKPADLEPCCPALVTDGSQKIEPHAGNASHSVDSPRRSNPRAARGWWEALDTGGEPGLPMRSPSLNHAPASSVRRLFGFAGCGTRRGAMVSSAAAPRCFVARSGGSRARNQCRPVHSLYVQAGIRAAVPTGTNVGSPWRAIVQQARTRAIASEPRYVTTTTSA